MIFIMDMRRSMSKIKNYSQISNLSSYSVYVEDTSESGYFSISQLSETLSVGKNSFFIYGSPYLKSNSSILIELVDSEGNSIFSKPIAKYQEGLSRIISVEIYKDTAPGSATLTILGELSHTNDGVPVPATWVGKYNVKFKKTILIDPSKFNTSQIRFLYSPELNGSEALVARRNVTVGNITNASWSNISGIPSKKFYNINDDSRFIDYVILGNPNATTDFDIASMSNFGDLSLFTSSNSSVLTNTIIAPNSSSTGDLIIENTAADTNHLVQRRTNTLTNLTESFFHISTYASASSANRILHMYVDRIDTATDRAGVYFNPTTQELINYTTNSGSVLYSRCTQSLYGWSFVEAWVRVVNEAAPTASLVLRMATGSSAPYGLVYTGDGTSSLAVWNPAIQETIPLYFNQNMVGGTFTASVNGNTYTSVIQDVYSNRILSITPPLVSGSTYLNFTSASYAINYTTSSYSVTSTTESFAILKLTNLKTFSGMVYKSKFYIKNYGNYGDYEFFGEKILEPYELTETMSFNSGAPIIKTGIIQNRSFANQYWIADTIGSTAYSTGASTTDNLNYSSSLIPIDCMFISGSGSAESVTSILFNSASATPVAFVGSRYNYLFTKDVEYKLQVDLSCIKNINFIGKLEIYLYGTAFPTRNSYGVKIATYESDAIFLKQDFLEQDINFVPLETGIGSIRFVIYGGRWLFSNIILSTAMDHGYHPEEVVAKINMNNRPSGSYQFKAELLTLTGEALPVVIESPIIFFSGSR